MNSPSESSTTLNATDKSVDTVATTNVPNMGADIPQPPTKDAFLMNAGMILVLGILFYLLLIRPQQKRFKEHAAMLGGLEKGTKVVTQGGLVGTIDKVVSDVEVIVDFGNNVKMTIMRSYIIGRYEDSLSSQSIANDDNKKKKDKNSK